MNKLISFLILLPFFSLSCSSQNIKEIVPFEYDRVIGNSPLSHLYKGTNSETFVLPDYNFIKAYSDELKISQIREKKNHFLVKTFDIKSKESYGTEVVLQLPKSSNPKWFLDELRLKTNDTNVQYVFLDNNQMVVDLWELAAQGKGVSFRAFKNAPDFLEFVASSDKDVCIYVDVDLGLELTGVDILKKLYNDGYKNLFLTTGYSNCDFDMDFIKGVVGKEPPFA